MHHPVRTRAEIEKEIDDNWSSMGYSVKPTQFMALTYDDGPSDKSEALMAAFAAKNVRVTFFLIGNRIAGKEAIVRKMRDAGHELANHSWSHPGSGLGSMSDQDIATEIQKCTDAIFSATNADGKPVLPNFFRAPSLNYSTNVYNVCRDKGFPLTAGISARDYGGGANNGSADAMANTIVNDAGDWKITLNHDPASGGDNWNNIILAVPKIVDGLRAKGYYLLPLSEMLVMRNGGTPNAGTVYQDFAALP